MDRLVFGRCRSADSVLDLLFGKSLIDLKGDSHSRDVLTPACSCHGTPVWRHGTSKKRPSLACCSLIRAGCGDLFALSCDRTPSGLWAFLQITGDGLQVSGAWQSDRAVNPVPPVSFQPWIRGVRYLPVLTATRSQYLHQNTHG